MVSLFVLWTLMPFVATQPAENLVLIFSPIRNGSECPTQLTCSTVDGNPFVSDRVKCSKKRYIEDNTTTTHCLCPHNVIANCTSIELDDGSILFYIMLIIIVLIMLTCAISLIIFYKTILKLLPSREMPFSTYVAVREAATNFHLLMGCLANFVSARKLLEVGELEQCDIIEFNRMKYSHYGLYIGRGVVVSVMGPDSGMSASSSSFKKYSKGIKQAEKLVDLAGREFLCNKVRINNCVLLAKSLGLEERSRQAALDKALDGLDTDYRGQVILDRPVAYDYNLIHNNCEYFATRCKYKCDGFSIQVANPAMHTTFGTIERVTSSVRDDLVDVIADDDQHLLVRGAAVGAYATHTAVGWTAYGAKTATDATVAAATAGLMSVASLFKKL